MEEVNLETIETTYNEEQEIDDIEEPQQNYNAYEPEEEYEQYEEEEPEEEERFGIDRRRKILLLQFYLNEFPKKLKGYRRQNLEELSNDELDKLKDEFDFVIGCNTTTNTTVTAFKKSIEVLEHIGCNYTPLKIQGLSMINQDKELMDDVRHWALQNMDMIQTKPEHRIMYKVLSSAMALHNINTINEARQQNTEAGIDNLNNEYDDL